MRDAFYRFIDSDGFRLTTHIVALPFLLAASPFIAFADYLRETFGE